MSLQAVGEGGLVGERSLGEVGIGRWMQAVGGGYRQLGGLASRRVGQWEESERG